MTRQKKEIIKRMTQLEHIIDLDEQFGYIPQHFHEEEYTELRALSNQLTELCHNDMSLLLYH